MVESDLDRLLETTQKQLLEATLRGLRFEHPWVADLIMILRGHPEGRSRARVIELLERERLDAGLPMPAKFGETVQNAYNRHADGYSEFNKSKKIGEKPLFFSPKGKHGGVWAVDEDAAAAWLIEKIPPLPPDL
jgi:hypothetical protein